jgi:hypothetical protein
MPYLASIPSKNSLIATRWDTATHPTSTYAKDKCLKDDIDPKSFWDGGDKSWNSRLKQVWTEKYGKVGYTEGNQKKTARRLAISSPQSATTASSRKRTASSTATDRKETSKIVEKKFDLSDIEILESFSNGEDLRDRGYPTVAHYYKTKYNLSDAPSQELLEGMKNNRKYTGMKPTELPDFKDFIKSYTKDNEEDGNQVLTSKDMQMGGYEDVADDEEVQPKPDGMNGKAKNVEAGDSIKEETQESVFSNRSPHKASASLSEKMRKKFSVWRKAAERERIKQRQSQSVSSGGHS